MSVLWAVLCVTHCTGLDIWVNETEKAIFLHRWETGGGVTFCRGSLGLLFLLLVRIACLLALSWVLMPDFLLIPVLSKN